MELAWANNTWAIGDCYGYTLHSKKLKEAVEAAGVAITLDPKDADLVVHVTTPDLFRPVPGKRNLLFLQVELSEPFIWSETVEQADLLVTSCKHSRDVLVRYFPGPVEICPLGVDVALFPYFERKAPAPGSPWRFLFFGNLNERRKGADQLFAAWHKWQASGRMPPCQLYVKDSGYSDGFMYQVPTEKPRTVMDLFALPPAVKNDIGNGWPPGAIHDSRNLSIKELNALYQSAHCFLMPSCGEAFGMCLTEAQATGAPSAWTAYSAPLDYADTSTGFPITDFEMIPFFRYGKPYAVGAAAKEDAIIGALEQIIADYPAALALGRRASERMRSCYTWSKAAEKFLSICERAMSLPIKHTAVGEGVRA